MTTIKPPYYWRKNKEWKDYIGRVGTVVLGTYIHVADEGRAKMTPYSYVVVDFGDEKRELMGVGHERLEVGDRVKCVLRKLSVSDDSGVIEYGVKVKRIKK